MAAALACAGLAGCVMDTLSERNGASGQEDCTTLDFDDGPAGPIDGGFVVETSYAPIGVTIDVWDDAGRTDDGLGVAFDTDNPTGGDDDLDFAGSGLGNVLINQEHFDAGDVAAGFVDEPDDEARGALFELTFDEPVCVRSLTALDIDFDEDPIEIELFDAAGNVVGSHAFDPMGNNERIDVALPATQCVVVRATVLISSSGAIDNIEICEGGQLEPILWTQIFDGGGDDQGRDVAADSRGDAVVVGTSETPAGFDGLIRKYDGDDGDLVWAVAVDGGFGDDMRGVDTDTTDNIVVAGSSDNSTDSDVFVRKLDPDGIEIWTQSFDGGSTDTAFSVAVDVCDHVTVTGFTTVAAGTVIWTRKYDPDGNVLWTRTFDQGVTDIGFGIAADEDLAVYVAGRVDNGTDFDIWVRKYDFDGNTVWTETFDSGGDDSGFDVAVDTNGEIVVTGAVFNGTDSDLWLRRMSAADGSEVWTRTFDGGGVDVGRGVATDAAGNAIVNGSADASTTDAITRKYDRDGTLVWNRVFDGGAADHGMGVDTDPAGAVFVTGDTDNGSDLDLYLRKYSP